MVDDVLQEADDGEDTADDRARRGDELVERNALLHVLVRRVTLRETNTCGVAVQT